MLGGGINLSASQIPSYHDIKILLLQYISCKKNLKTQSMSKKKKQKRSSSKPLSPTNRETLAIWQRSADTVFPEALRIDVARKRFQAEKESVKLSQDHLEFWLAILDEALHFLLSVQSLAQECVDNAKQKPSPAFLFLVSRCCSLVTAIRKLVIYGLEDAARSIVRSLLESLDLAIVCFVDTDFSKGFSFNQDENDFWKKNIAYGKLDKKVKEILTIIDFNEDELNTIFTKRRTFKALLSSSVHSSMSSAFASTFVASISRPGKFSPSVFGHVSIHSPKLISLAISEVHQFGYIITKLVMSKNPPTMLTNATPLLFLPSVLVGYLSLQEIILKYPKKLSPYYLEEDIKNILIDNEHSQEDQV